MVARQQEDSIWFEGHEGLRYPTLSSYLIRSSETNHKQNSPTREYAIYIYRLCDSHALNFKGQSFLLDTGRRERNGGEERVAGGEVRTRSNWELWCAAWVSCCGPAAEAGEHGRASELQPHRHGGMRTGAAMRTSAWVTCGPTIAPANGRASYRPAAVPASGHVCG